MLYIYIYIYVYIHVYIYIYIQGICSPSVNTSRAAGAGARISIAMTGYVRLGPRVAGTLPLYLSCLATFQRLILYTLQLGILL